MSDIIEWEYGVRHGDGAVYAWGGTHEGCIGYAARCDETWGAGTHTVVRRPKPPVPEWELVEA